MTVRETRPATLNEIQTGIKRRLETIEGLHPTATEPANPHLPAAYPRVTSWTYDLEQGEDQGIEWQFDLWVLVAISPDLTRAQSTINDYLSAHGRLSLKRALEEEPTLGGLVDFLRVTGGGNYGRVDVGGESCLGASVRVEVLT